MEAATQYEAKAAENARAARLCLAQALHDVAAVCAYYAALQRVCAFLVRRDRFPPVENRSHVRVIRTFANVWRESFGTCSEVRNELQTLFKLRRDAHYHERRVSRREAMGAFRLSADLRQLIDQKENRHAT